MSTELNVKVTARTGEALGVISLELRAADGSPLPPFGAGAHIDVHLPVRDAQGRFLVRQYSLCNDPAEQDRYVIGVGRDPNSRGGSLWLQDQLQVGDLLHISAPRNNFPLDESAAHSVLVAGGIGITPLLAMSRRLRTLGRPWTLYYCARTPERAAFLEELRAMPARVVPVFDGLPGGEPLDLGSVIADAPADAHLYCCGPASLMEAFELAAARRPRQQVHVEWFKPRAAAAHAQAQSERPFDITLARGRMMLHVPVGKSILDVLIEAGVAIPHSCCDGVCGTCETRVIEGVPEHRDAVLLGEAANISDRMMVCVSRSAGPHLTLDL
ncbi:PDR/VanB family oxidoreductase [Variovorax sp. LjRoot178]|uniref:PDR/VanB family oxidoreductase n=1 Tax=Variovorax sp. LjRoot178 TaxID=3342277 RepID=UPI003ED0ACC2